MSVGEQMGPGETGPGEDGLARVLDIVGKVQALGLASAAAVAERSVGAVDRYLAERAAPVGRWEWLAQAAPPDPRPEVLRLPATSPGGSSAGSLWVHSTSPARALVTVRAGPLTSADGVALTPVVEPVDPSLHRGTAPTSRTESPAGTTEVGAHGPAEVRLHVRVPAGTPPGHFHGVVTCSAAPSRALPVLLEVLGPQEPTA